ncbi:DUF3221 domain-containing protein [Gracilibacillus salitolerans]|uniref:DUF3221 domain-containing protein n=1 Tax=Gracilibacillus salitolerans TaxID=2663022 RepID=A0A5Q2TKM7_9BACI|nr:DUF3221 domain-containing protein [Gracilibacillus salitolerans]QGH35195.1 DUF3221 domain-containing protein [Gracilibacillus salitolerans]
MKKCILLVLITISIGCSEERAYSDKPDFIGVVLAFEDSNLLQMTIKSGNIKQYGYDDEIVISVENMEEIENLEKGEEIKVWIDGQLSDNQPPQGKLGKYETTE